MSDGIYYEDVDSDSGDEAAKDYVNIPKLLATCNVSGGADTPKQKKLSGSKSFGETVYYNKAPNPAPRRSRSECENAGDGSAVKARETYYTYTQEPLVVWLDASSKGGPRVGDSGYKSMTQGYVPYDPPEYTNTEQRVVAGAGGYVPYDPVSYKNLYEFRPPPANAAKAVDDSYQTKDDIYYEDCPTDDERKEPEKSILQDKNNEDSYAVKSSSNVYYEDCDSDDGGTRKNDQATSDVYYEDCGSNDGRRGKISNNQETSGVYYGECDSDDGTRGTTKNNQATSDVYYEDCGSDEESNVASKNHHDDGSYDKDYENIGIKKRDKKEKDNLQTSHSAAATSRPTSVRRPVPTPRTRSKKTSQPEDDDAPPQYPAPAPPKKVPGKQRDVFDGYGYLAFNTNSDVKTRGRSVNIRRENTYQPLENQAGQNLDQQKFLYGHEPEDEFVQVNYPVLNKKKRLKKQSSS